MSRTCAKCHRVSGDMDSFELVCFCDKNHGVCRACFDHDFANKDAADIAAVRTYGRHAMGGEHALRRRNASKSTRAAPVHASLAFQDPDFLKNMQNFMQGKPMDTNSPYAVYVSPAMQKQQQQQQQELYVRKKLCHFFLCVSIIIFYLAFLVLKDKK